MEFGSGEWRSLIARIHEGDAMRRLWQATYQMPGDRAEAARAMLLRTVQTTGSWHLLNWIEGVDCLMSGRVRYVHHQAHREGQCYVLDLPIQAEAPREGVMRAAVIEALHQYRTHWKLAPVDWPALSHEWLEEAYDNRSIFLQTWSDTRIRIEHETILGAWVIRLGVGRIVFTCSPLLAHYLLTPKRERKARYTKMWKDLATELHGLGIAPKMGNWVMLDGEYLPEDPPAYCGNYDSVRMRNPIYGEEIGIAQIEGQIRFPDGSVSPESLASKMHDHRMNVPRPLWTGSWKF